MTLTPPATPEPPNVDQVVEILQVAAGDRIAGAVWESHGLGMGQLPPSSRLGLFLVDLGPTHPRTATTTTTTTITSHQGSSLEPRPPRDVQEGLQTGLHEFNEWLLPGAPGPLMLLATVTHPPKEPFHA